MAKKLKKSSKRNTIKAGAVSITIGKKKGWYI